MSNVVANVSNQYVAVAPAPQPSPAISPDETSQIIRGIKEGLKSSGQSSAADVTGVATVLYSLHRKLSKGSDLEKRFSDPEVSTLANISIGIDVTNLGVTSSKAIITLTKATEKVGAFLPISKMLGPISTSLRFASGVVDYHIAYSKHDVPAGERAIANTIGGTAGGVLGGMAGVELGSLIGAFLGAAIPVVGIPLGAAVGAGVVGVAGSIAGTWGGSKLGKMVVHETMGDWLAGHFAEASHSKPYTSRPETYVPDASMGLRFMPQLNSRFASPQMCPV